MSQDPFHADEPREPVDSAPEVTESMALYRRFQDGDADALNRLFELNYPMVRRVVQIRMSARLGRYQENEDLVQTALCTALRSLPNFEMRGPGSFRAWLRRIIDNTVAGLARHEDAQKRGHDQLISDIELSPDSGALRPTERAPGFEASPSLAMKLDEYQIVVDECLAKLKEREREVLLLRRYLAHPWPEVAEQLGCPSVGAAEQLAQRAKEHLGELLKRRSKDLPSGLGAS